MRTRERTAPYDSLPVESKPVGLFFHSKVSNFPLNFKFVSFFFKDGLHYDCVSIQQPPVKPAADEDGYIIPMRMKSSPSFSSVSTSSASPSQRHSLTSFHPPQEGQPPPRRRSGVRQSRQDLHVKLEDHYGTVTGANFQALAQLLEQVIYHSSFINEACKKILPRLLRNSSYTLDCRRLARDHWRPTFTS